MDSQDIYNLAAEKCTIYADNLICVSNRTCTCFLNIGIIVNKILFHSKSRKISISQRKHKRYLNKSNRIHIVFTIFQLIWNQTYVHLFQINRKMVNTIWFRFDLIRFRKHFPALRVHKGATRRGPGFIIIRCTKCDTELFLFYVSKILLK